MNKLLLLTFLVAIFFVQTACNSKIITNTAINSTSSQQTQTTRESDMLELILADKYKGEGYVIIQPYTEMDFMNIPEVLDNLKSFLSDSLNGNLKSLNYEFTPLIEEFFEINRIQENLKIESSIKDGYYINNEYTYARYLQDLNNGLLPIQVVGYIKLTLPAYDPETGYVILHISFTNNSTTHFGGGGAVYVYRYINEELIYITKVQLSIK
ncbi:MAG: hypothetical protein PHE15_03550 [Dehalococcoidales bacterium]|nr:hypothetical protein [Dehalococcoidales bacterium]